MAKPRILIIDNGSYECRVGWSDADCPELKFRNVLTKPRKDRKKEKEKDKETPETNTPVISVIQVGNDISNIEAVRAQLKSPFDRNVITNWNHQEQILDYIFSNMGYDNQSNISNSIVMTEALANPNYCRQQMSELLFECYGVPAVNYGIDALFSWRHYQQQQQPQSDALIVSFGFSTIHVIPLLDGKVQLPRVRRLNVGGYHIITFLFRLMQMKYPVHVNAITISRIESLVHQNCCIAEDYQHELNKWASLEYYEENVHKIQLPYNAVAVANAMLTVEQKQERRRELAYRLIEMKNRREREKLKEDEQQLAVLASMRQLYEQNKLQKFEGALREQEIANLEELDKLIETVRQRIERVKERANAQPKPKPQQQDKIPKPPAGVSQTEWLAELRTKRDEIIKRKQTRQAQRQEQAKRHTHAAQERMRIISTLARTEKRRKGNEEDDGFGMNDDDWDVYKRINRYNDDSDSDSDNEKLLECEKILSHYDIDDTTAAQAVQATTAAEDYQLHFGVEAIRAAEILFQPSMVGCPEAGLSELIAYVLKLFTGEEQQRMVQHVYLTGGCAQFKGLQERLHKELMEMRPFQSTFAIYVTSEPMLGAWKGACDFSRSLECTNTLTTRADYDEFGGEFFKQHASSNLYFPTPKD